MKPFRIIFLILPAMIISYFVKTVPYNEFQGLFSCRDYYSVFSATRVKKSTGAFSVYNNEMANDISVILSKANNSSSISIGAEFVEDIFYDKCKIGPQWPVIRRIESSALHIDKIRSINGIGEDKKKSLIPIIFLHNSDVEHPLQYVRGNAEGEVHDLVEGLHVLTPHELLLAKAQWVLGSSVVVLSIYILFKLAGVAECLKLLFS